MEPNNEHATMIIRHLSLASLVALVAATVALASGGNREKEEDPKPVVTHTAVIKTSTGDIEIELYGVDAPKTVANFVGLAQKDFYNGILFHRIVPGFVIQVGDPKTKDVKLKGEWGTGGESIYGGTFVDELNPQAPSYQLGYKRGVLAMANRGPNTNTSQFFINLRDNEGLPKSYTMFGKVTKGMEIVDEIAGVPTDGGQRPITPITIESIAVTAAE